MYLFSFVDIVLILVLIGIILVLVVLPQVDAVTGILGMTESLIWSSARWVSSSQTKTQVVVRTGVVWSFAGWIIKPLFGITKRWIRTRKEFS